MAFPLLEKEAGQTGLMDSNIDQHNAFTEGIEAFKAYVTKVAQKKAAYDGQKMVQLLNNFGSVLAGHLNDEIATISALDNYSIDWNNYNKILTKHAVKNADKVNPKKGTSKPSTSQLTKVHRTKKFLLS